MIDGSVGNLNAIEPVAGAIMGISLSRAWRTFRAAKITKLVQNLDLDRESNQIKTCRE